MELNKFPRNKLQLSNDRVKVRLIRNPEQLSSNRLIWCVYQRCLLGDPVPIMVRNPKDEINTVQFFMANNIKESSRILKLAKLSINVIANSSDTIIILIITLLRIETNKIKINKQTKSK